MNETVQGDEDWIGLLILSFCISYIEEVKIFDWVAFIYISRKFNEVVLQFAKFSFLKWANFLVDLSICFCLEVRSKIFDVVSLFIIFAGCF